MTAFLVLLLVYVAVVGWLTWPLGAFFSTALPCAGAVCGFDTLYSAWVLAWQTHALATSPLQLIDGNIYVSVRRGPSGMP